MAFSSHMTPPYLLPPHHRLSPNIFLPKYWPSWWRACAPSFHGQNLDEIEKGQEQESGGTGTFGEDDVCQSTMEQVSCLA
jgi:hypothetical protein